MVDASVRSSRITDAPRPDATPETEISVLARIYEFVLDCRAKKEDARSGVPDDGTTVQGDSTGAPIIQE
jgi:hypothetical protein